MARIGLQVAEALEHAHRQGVLHRDVKPSNLLLDNGGTVWVTDFGLAKVEDQPNLTHTGDILGTLRYMPPEAFDGRADRRGDVYSLGLTLYELLAMRPAFEEKERNQLIKRVTTEEPPRLDKLNREIPRDLVTDRPQGDRPRAGAALPDGRRAGRRPAALPRRRADPGPAGEPDGAAGALVPPEPRRGRPGGGAGGWSSWSASPASPGSGGRPNRQTDLARTAQTEEAKQRMIAAGTRRTARRRRRTGPAACSTPRR